MAGEYPCSPIDAEARRKVRWLLENGVTYCLDLTVAGESNLKPYAHLLQEEAAAIAHQATHQRMPIPDLGTPTPAEMQSILDTLEEALQAGHTVYLHCYGGIGRTGTVVGCYLVQHGLSGKEALAHIAHLRKDIPDGWIESPETADQRRLILNWQASH
jgi:protein-tyrosine phosphatase